MGFPPTNFKMKAFSPTWSSWFQTLIQGGNVGLKVNDQVGPYLQTKKKLRQGDPLSPILFNIMVDTLVIMIARTTQNG